MTVEAALGNAGIPWTIDHEGKTFRVRKLTQGVKKAFSTQLSQRVLRQFLAAQDGEGGAYDGAVALLADRIAAGRYDFAGPVAQQSLRTEEGVFGLAMLMIDVDEEDDEGRKKPRRPVTEDELIGLLAARGAELNAVMKVVFAASRPKVPESPRQESSGEGDDPNPPGPAD